MIKSVCLLLLIIVPALTKSQSISLDDKLVDLLDGSVPIIKSFEAKQLIDTAENIIIFDTRTQKEFEVSAIKDAIFIDFGSFDPSIIHMPSKQDTLIFYCTVGYRSEQIAVKFKELGFDNVYNLYGGILDWVNTGYPVLKNNILPTDSVHTFDKEWSQWLKNGIEVYD